MAKETKQKKTRADYMENALYREIWEDVHTQKTYDFFKKYKKLLIIIVSIILMLAIISQVYRYESNKNSKKSALSLESAMAMIADNEYDSAHHLLNKIAKTYSTAISDIARYQDAILYSKQNNSEKYLETLEKLAHDGNTRDFRDLAIIRIALIKSDNVTAKELTKILSPVLTSRSPYYFTGLWIIATKYESENNDKLAISYYKKIIENKNAPAIIVAQTESTLASMGQLNAK